MRRRDFLHLTVLGGAAMTASSWTTGCGDRTGGAGPGLQDLTVEPRASLYGKWALRAGLPTFVYDADQEALAAAEWTRSSRRGRDATG